MSPDLKKCPSCGGEAIQGDQYTYIESGIIRLRREVDRIRCMNPTCGVTGPWDDPDGSFWNLLPRHDDPKPAAPGMSDGELIARAVHELVDTVLEAATAIVGQRAPQYMGDESVDAELARREKERKP